MDQKDKNWKKIVYNFKGKLRRIENSIAIVSSLIKWLINYLIFRAIANEETKPLLYRKNILALA